MAKEKTLPTRHSLPAKTRASVGALLNTALADLSDLYSQSKQAHWNVRGPRFYSLHKLFDEVAGLVEGHLDDVAERAVQLGTPARGTIRMAAAVSRVPEWPAGLASEDAVLEALTARFATVANSIREAIDTAADLGDADTADLLTGISQDLDKSLWFLEASA
ncbi:MAG: DNA starvation/stationary phase protection protein Dps [Verrucomicrobiales bacterium]|nr:DNA starvation/stationary phase protection protein Dps [Verrucomicrobiales bacterium]